MRGREREDGQGSICACLGFNLLFPPFSLRGPRQMLSSRVRSTTVSAVVAGFLAAVVISRAQNFTDLKPSPQALEWQDLEFGVLIHFGPNTFLGKEWGDGTASPSTFNPTQFDPEQWMKAIKSAGARYVVIVAKHHDGFCLWPTKQTEYSVKTSTWKNGGGD